GLLEAAEYGRLALPQHVDCLRLVTDPPGGQLYATATLDGDGFDCVIQDAAGQVVLALDGYRTVAIPATVPDDIRRGLSSSGKPEMSRAGRVPAPREPRRRLASTAGARRSADSGSSTVANRPPGRWARLPSSTRTARARRSPRSCCTRTRTRMR